MAEWCSFRHYGLHRQLWVSSKVGITDEFDFSRLVGISLAFRDSFKPAVNTHFLADILHVAARALTQRRAAPQ